MTPCIGTVNLYKTSGHWDHYRENMFPAMEMEGESYVLRPMNSPHHMMIYTVVPILTVTCPCASVRSPTISVTSPSGTLKGIERGCHCCRTMLTCSGHPEQIRRARSQRAT